MAFCELNRVVYAETLLDYTEWTILFTVHTYSSGKQFGAIISQTDKPIYLFL